MVQSKQSFRFSVLLRVWLDNNELNKIRAQFVVLFNKGHPCDVRENHICCDRGWGSLMSSLTVSDHRFLESLQGTMTSPD